MISLGHTAFDTAAGDGVADSLPWSGAEAAGIGSGSLGSRCKIQFCAQGLEKIPKSKTRSLNSTGFLDGCNSLCLGASVRSVAHAQGSSGAQTRWSAYPGV